MPDLDRTFRLLTGHVRMLSWQRRLYRGWFRRGRLPEEIDVPTGLGKTSVMALWLMALAEQLRTGREERLPLRYVHVVDDRAMVDQASIEAERIARNLRFRSGLAWMRQALGGGGEGLAVSTLHGRSTGGSRWLADPASPAIIVGTAEETAARLLFAGSGLSPRMRAVQASLLAVDALLVMDEVRFMPHFARLAGWLAEGGADPWPQAEAIRPPRTLPMSAVGGRGGRVFALEESDRLDGIVAKRLEVCRRLRVERTGAGDGAGEVLASRLADAAWRLAHGVRAEAPSPRTVVFCDDEGLAERVHAALAERVAEATAGRPEVTVRLLAGRRRVFEHNAVADDLRRFGFLPGAAGGADVPVILVAASTIAESMDLEADRIVCDVVPLERMILRFGRLGRRAERTDGRVVVVADEMRIARHPGAERLRKVVGILECLGDDASSAALLRLRDRAPELFAAGLSPEPEEVPSGFRLPEPGRVSSASPDCECPADVAGTGGGSRSELLWRVHLPWRPGAPVPEGGDVAGYLAAAAPHPLEGLEGKAPDIAALLIRRAAALLKGPERRAAPVSRDRRDGPGVILLSPCGEFEDALDMRRLAGMTVAELEERIGGRKVLCPACLGGLDAHGRPDPSSDAEVPAVDGGWPEEWRACAGFRVRRVSGEGLCRLERGWNRLFVMDMGGEKGETGDFLVVDVMRGRRVSSAGGDIPGRDGEGERLALVAAEVAHMAADLGLPDGPARALELAGAWLDLGRAHDLWRRAFDALPGGASRSAGRSGRGRAGGRDGWESLFDMMEQIMPTDLDAEIRDLVHHLVGTHADAVPLASPEGGEEREEAEGGGVDARRARLQRRYGRWGLAWLETLLWVAECRAASEDRPPCWRDGCADGIAGGRA